MHTGIDRVDSPPRSAVTTDYKSQQDEGEECATSKEWLSQMQIYVVNLLKELERLEKMESRSIKHDTACLSLITDAGTKLDSIDAVCNEELSKQSKAEEPTQQTVACLIGGKPLVPASRHRYMRYWASKVCL